MRALALALLLPSLAFAQEPDPRDEEMFGGGEERTRAGTDTDRRGKERQQSTASPIDEPVRSQGLISDLLAKADDPLAIGGRLSLRFQYTRADEHAANGNLLASPSVMYLFLDARPNDRVRAFARGRLTYDFTLQDGKDASGLPAEALGTSLDQLWLKADVAKAAYLTIGRQPIRWGSGRFWNPTDFLNRSRRDPLAIFDERIGPTLVKLHFPVESLGWNLYAIASLDDAKHPEDVGAAGRAEFLFGPVETSVSAAWRKDNPLRLGLDVSAGVWLLDFRAEAAVAYDDSTPYWTGAFDPAAGALPTARIRDRRWSPQATGAIEAQVAVSDQDQLILGAEYFFNDAGYADASLYDWLLLRSATGAPGGFTPFHLGRHYVAAYAYLPYPGNWDDTTFTLSGIGNLSDRTGILRLDWQVRVLTYLDVAVFGAVHLGDRGEFHYGATVPPLAGLPAIPGVPEVPAAYRQGFSIPAARGEVGVWLTLAL
ncbi:MAG: hypothetical protein FJ087_05715 [Deltaproteobacteria bacterium]|nr:hypothetical protein [Deltaproteobacteria bacterium]